MAESNNIKWGDFFRQALDALQHIDFETFISPYRGNLTLLSKNCSKPTTEWSATVIVFAIPDPGGSRKADPLITLTDSSGNPVTDSTGTPVQDRPMQPWNPGVVQHAFSYQGSGISPKPADYLVKVVFLDSLGNETPKEIDQSLSCPG